MLTRFAQAKNLTRTTQFVRPFSSGGMGGGMSASHSSGSAAALELWETSNRSGIIVTCDDKPGQLVRVLSILDKYQIDMTQI